MKAGDFKRIINEKAFPCDFPGHWIGTKFIGPLQSLKGELFAINPNSGETLLRYAIDSSKIEAALNFGESEFLEKRALNDRLETLDAFRAQFIEWRHELISCIKIECGKTETEARSEFIDAVRILDKIIDNPDEIRAFISGRHFLSKGGSSRIELLPSQTTVAFLPFVSPLSSLAMYYGSSVLTGSPLILCPSSHAVLVSLCFSFMLEEIDKKAGRACVLFGDFPRFKKILVDPRAQTIFYTGSRDHCAMIEHESKNFPGRKLVLQSGGKNALILDESVATGEAVALVIKGAFESGGQLCSSTSRVILPRSRWGSFKESLLASVEKLRIGRTDRDSGDRIDMGPLYSSKAVDRYLRYETMASRGEGEVILRGESRQIDQGFFVSPAIHEINVPKQTSAFESHVLFSPNLCVYPYKNLSEAISLANHTDSPYVCSWGGDRELFESHRHLLVAPNLVYGIATTDLDPLETVSASLAGGHQRYIGLEMAAALCYPQVSHFRGEGDYVRGQE